MTQSALAQLVGVQPSQVSLWERGRHQPTTANLAAVADATGRDLAWFFTEHPEEAAA
jgi:transcriptional regulator with XRE-family HTH domain